MAESISSEKKRSKEYEVESIQDDRKRKDHYDHKTKKWVYITEYLIKWVGYRRRSWEPEENLNNCIQMLNSYKKIKIEIVIVIIILMVIKIIVLIEHL
jgi:hypothetical protein